MSVVGKLKTQWVFGLGYFDQKSNFLTKKIIFIKVI